MAFELERPADEAAALRAVAGAGAGEVAVVAGGTDLVLDIELGRLAPRRVVSLARVPWRELERTGDRLRVGALLPLRELEKAPGLAVDHPGLFEAIRAVGSPALRTRATLGGNIGRSAPSSDLLPVLLALDARVELRSSEGARTVPIGDLLAGSRRPGLRPGELIRSIELPAVAPSAYVWQRVRPSNDVSQVGVAVARADGGGWRIALGGVPPVPQRLPEAEAGMGRGEPTDARIAAAAEAAARSAPFVSDKRATEGYRRVVVRALAARALERVRGRAAGAGGVPG